ncbi:hypothetical protein DV515_00011770, partial [Chloebia gouldiae]
MAAGAAPLSEGRRPRGVRGGGQRARGLSGERGPWKFTAVKIQISLGVNKESKTQKKVLSITTTRIGEAMLSLPDTQDEYKDRKFPFKR